MVRWVRAAPAVAWYCLGTLGRNSDVGARFLWLHELRTIVAASDKGLLCLDAATGVSPVVPTRCHGDSAMLIQRCNTVRAV